MRLPTCHWIVFVLLWFSGHRAAAETNFASARQRLVENQVAANGVTDPRVLDAMRATKRHEFVPTSQRKLAYFDMALPIGNSQTISSPFIVAYMTQSLEPKSSDKVLEIGTGSGYQAAVLSPLVKSVYSIEIVEPLGRRARRVLQRLQYDNVHTKIGDGFVGWPEHAPFDKIIVTCSPEDVPQPLVDQLREGGRMVIPVGERYQQTLCLMTKRSDKLVREELRPTLFVPMTGAAEDNRDVLPDPSKPTIVNGSFEVTTKSTKNPESHQHETEEHIPGWYYQRLATVVEEPQSAPHRDRYVRFSNETPGRSSHILQGFAIDGRAIREINVAGSIRLENVVRGADSDMRPSIAVTFYDERRRQLGHHLCGPWQGTRPWETVTKQFRVPPLAREAILRIGLFGATGDFYVDNLRVTSAHE